MAKQFLDRLAKIPEGDLSKGSSCMVCRLEYEYGRNSIDVAVRLPCNHHVGLECITKWLSQDSRNSCPMCRRVFFDVIDEEEEQRYYREILRRVGQPPEERPAAEDNSPWLNTWYHYFVEAAAEQYQQSLRRAEAYVARKYPRHDRHDIEDRATAFRTLPIRETFLYQKFAREGALPPVADLVSGPLNAEQLDALFRELQRRGAFDIELHPFPSYHGLTDRQMWVRHREEGESYSTWEGGYWSLSLG